MCIDAFCGAPLQDSILDIKVPLFKEPGELPEIRSYMEEFPFPFYVILRDVNALPETLSDALRQWFELVTTADQWGWGFFPPPKVTFLMKEIKLYC